MTNTRIVFTEDAFQRIRRHLLPERLKHEEAAFGFLRPRNGEPGIFDCVDWQLVDPHQFESRSAFYLELTDEVRASVIKKAHDLQASLLEFHSHLHGGVPSFSGSDLLGFGEFVPHVWWRLKGRPYFAIVMSRGGYDALAWVSSPSKPSALSCISIGDRNLEPTNLTLAEIEVDDERAL